MSIKNRLLVLLSLGSLDMCAAQLAICTIPPIDRFISVESGFRAHPLYAADLAQNFPRKSGPLVHLASNFVVWNKVYGLENLENCQDDFREIFFGAINRVVPIQKRILQKIVNQERLEKWFGHIMPPSDYTDIKLLYPQVLDLENKFWWDNGKRLPCFHGLPLAFAMEVRDLSLIRALVQAGVSTEDYGENYFPPMSYALLHGYIDSMRVLLELGVNPNQKNWQGETLLAEAIKRGRLWAVKMLVFYGASLQLGKLYPRETPLDLARNELTEIQQTLCHLFKQKKLNGYNILHLENKRDTWQNMVHFLERETSKREDAQEGLPKAKHFLNNVAPNDPENYGDALHRTSSVSGLLLPNAKRLRR